MIYIISEFAYEEEEIWTVLEGESGIDIEAELKEVAEYFKWTETKVERLILARRAQFILYMEVKYGLKPCEHSLTYSPEKYYGRLLSGAEVK